MLQTIKDHFSRGTVLYDEFFVDPNRDLADQLEQLGEDLFQVEFPHELLVGIGWYPSHSASGQFRIFVIKACNWEEPLFDVRCKTLEDLDLRASECASRVDALIQSISE